MHPIFCKYFYRPLSFPIGWIIYKLGVKANYVSLFSILLTLVAFIVIIFGNNESILVASFLMMLVALSDCIDGNVARARNETGPGGEWMDAFSGYTVYMLLPFGLGIHMFLSNPNQNLPGLWVIIGSLNSILNLYLRLLYQKFINCQLEKFSKTKIKREGTITSILSGEMGLVGWMIPMLFFAELTNTLWLYMSFYCFFYFISAIITSIILVTRIP